MKETDDSPKRRGMHIIRAESQWNLIGARNGDFSLEELAFETGYRVDMLCDRVGCSTRNFDHVFMRDIGIPPKRWLQEERMAAALRMLTARPPPPEVARLLGFAHARNFGREFVATYGISPAHFEDFLYKRGPYLGWSESVALADALVRHLRSR